MTRHIAMVGLVLLLQSAASADTFMVSGSGVFDGTAPTTPIGAPDGTWAFSFDVDSPLPGNLVPSVSDFSYSLNGSAVSEPLAAVQFYSAGDFGLFSLFFTGGDFMQLYGGQAYDAGNNLIPGLYPAVVDIDATNTAPLGEGTGIITISAVPEPSSIVSACVGIGLIAGFAARRRRRRHAA